MAPFLLEIGTEEIPDSMIPAALEYLRSKFPGENVRVDATARRLVVRADVAARSADREEVVTGPPASVTGKALDGFCAKQGVSADALSVVETAKGKYWSFTRKIAGRDAAETLREELPGLILSIPWPKTMYWPSLGGPKFIRPIRWIVALLGVDVVPFDCAGVTASNVTFGHRRLGSRGPLTVTVSDFEQVLEENFVIVSAAKRRDKIASEVATMAAARGLRVKVDAKLLEVLTYITEYPTAILGTFDASYLTLPSEVLVTVMRHHQKYFSVEDAQGVLAPHFIAIMNIPADPDGHVVNGNERVLRARFNDARFFYDVDQRKPLAERVEDLSHVTFHAKVGNYLEKTARVAALAGELGGPDAAAAGQLCKADLTTEMVKEFTDLQGVVGGLYAKAQGAAPEVAQAIYEHYKPLSIEDSIPSTKAGQALSVADKLDTLRSCFAVGLIPSGSKDPFALRRAAQGVVKILVNGALRPDLRALLGSDALTDFFKDRIRYYFEEVESVRYDAVNAVLKAEWTNLSDFALRVRAIERVRFRPEFQELVRNFKRVNNIVRQAPEDVGYRIAVEQLPHAADGELYAFVEKRDWMDFGQNYEQQMIRLASAGPILGSFFEAVMVLSDDGALRETRVFFLRKILNDFGLIADFTEIVTN